jgi:hypothetical protein
VTQAAGEITGVVDELAATVEFEVQGKARIVCEYMMDLEPVPASA